jgi:hypothetical protein
LYHGTDEMMFYPLVKALFRMGGDTPHGVRCC